MLYDYQREELERLAELAKPALGSDCPLLEDEVAVAVWNHVQDLEEFVFSIVKEWVEADPEKIKEQRDRWRRKAYRLYEDTEVVYPIDSEDDDLVEDDDFFDDDEEDVVDGW